MASHESHEAKLYDDIIKVRQDFERHRESDQHLLCPRISDDDDTDYLTFKNSTLSAEQKQNRLQDGHSRMKKTLDYSLVVGLDEKSGGPWIRDFINALCDSVGKCNICAMNWYMYRGELLKSVSTRYVADVTRILEQRYDEIDFTRITTGLKAIERIMDESPGLPFTPQVLLNKDPSLLLPLFEALCSVRYISVPQNRALFDKIFLRIQEKKVLRIGRNAILPSMTLFLFDENPIRRKYALTAWQKVDPDIMTLEQWDWAVADQLSSQIRTMPSLPQIPPNTPPPVIYAPFYAANTYTFQMFWDGFALILRCTPEEVIAARLRTVQPRSPYNLGMDHLSCTSDELLTVLLGIWSHLMSKAPKAFWKAFESFAIPGVAQAFATARQFHSLLSKSDELFTPGTRTPVALCWLEPFIASLEVKHLEAVSDFIIRFLFVDVQNPNSAVNQYVDKTVFTTSKLAIGATRAGFEALGLALTAYTRPGSNIDTKGVGVNLTLQLVGRYHDVIIQSARSRDSHGVGLASAAVRVVKASLELDAKAFRAEWLALYQGRVKHVQDAVGRPSPALWDGASCLVARQDFETSVTILRASLEFVKTEKMIPHKHKTLEQRLVAWNSFVDATAVSVESVISNFSEFNMDDQARLCEDASFWAPIVHALFNSNYHLHVPALQLVKSMTDEFDRDGAVSTILSRHLAPFLTAYAGAVEDCIGDEINWGPILQILELNKSVLQGLCDASSGILRTKSLSEAERKAVSSWWQVQWHYLNRALLETEGWSKTYDVAKDVLSNFVRTAMEFGDDLLDQDGVFASALSSKTDDSGSPEESVMKTLMCSPQKCTGLAKMIRLRDLYLIKVIVNILTKLFNRLNQYKMKPHPEIAKFIKDTCVEIRGSSRGYAINSNLSPAQRAQLAQALGIKIEEDEDDDDSDVVISGSKPSRLLSRKPSSRQPTIDAWSKSGSSTSVSTPDTSRKPSVGRIGKLETDDLTPNLAKKANILEMMKAKQGESARQKRLKEEQRLAKKKQEDVQKAAQTKVIQETIKEKRKREQEERKKAHASELARVQALRQPTRLVAGEGSGLRGVGGILGKAHTPAVPPKSEIMVGSDDSDEESDDEGDGLDELLGRTKTKKHMTEEERKLALKSTIRGPVKKTKILHDDKSKRARIAPPMDELHQAILGWNIFHEGEDPPNQPACARVATNYRSPTDYKVTFMPLLIHEAWRSFATAKAECTNKPFGIKVTNRMTVDSFLEIVTAMPASANKDMFLAEGDIVLISKANEPLNSPKSENILARIKLVRFKQGTMDVTYRINTRPSSTLRPHTINPGNELYAVKITSMTTIEREYAALESVKYFDLCDEVIKAQPSPMLEYGPERVDKTMANYELNAGQAKAVLNATDNDGFTLVQGPPGTGKTKTIIAMAGSLLSSAGSLANMSVPKPGGLKKLLVCAPSNAAVDELVLRLKQGVKTPDGRHVKITVLRLGRGDAVNTAVKDVTLEELVKQKLEGRTGTNPFEERDKLHSRAGELKITLVDVRARMEIARANMDHDTASKLEREYDTHKKEQQSIGSKIDALKAKGDTRARDNKIMRSQIEQEFLDKAHVVCATLSGSGHRILRELRNVDFDTVIIDEAAQCVELSAIIPLKYGCTKCVLVGDPKQLPPTVLSQSAQKYGYDQSLFVRMQQNFGKDVHLLDKQYRMHPDISYFPSQEFYDSKLQDGKNMWELRKRPWHTSQYLSPYRFFNVEGSQQMGHRGSSLVNKAEVEVAMKLFQRFETDFGRHLEGKIGIITPYKAQLFLLRDQFTAMFGQGVLERIEFNTTDAFQGRECEIIIFSCVRADPTGGIGFMTDIRRMNVGLTRAKSSLWVLGSSRALEQGTYWRKLIKDARSRDVFTQGNIVSLLSQPGPTVDPEARRPKERPPPRETIEIDMTDAPEQPQRNPPLQVPQSLGPAVPIRAGPGRPVIHTASGTTGGPSSGSSDSRKRPLSSPGGPNGHPNKRPQPGQYPRPPQRPAVDVAAQETLGLVAPRRAPARNIISDSDVRPPPSGPQAPPGPRPRVPRPPQAKKPDPFIRRPNHRR